MRIQKKKIEEKKGDIRNKGEKKKKRVKKWFHPEQAIYARYSMRRQETYFWPSIHARGNIQAHRFIVLRICR
jgi:hypothetical protein